MALLLFIYLFLFEITKNRTAARDPHTKLHDKPWWRLLLIQSGVSASLQSLWKCAQSLNSGLTHLQSAKHLPLRRHPAPHRGLFSLHPLHQAWNFIHSVKYTGTKLPVTCMMCSSAPSACWRAPVRFSSRSSLCEEFGKWWGYTAEWQVLERHLPGWSDRTNWSSALQDRDSQTLSQKPASKRLKCSHPCWSSCRLYAVFTSSV